MRIETLFQGFPGKLASGYMGWSAVVFVETAGKKILFDTGGPGKRKDLCPRLQALGVNPSEIDMLVISHFHDDHVYNFDLIPNAAILLHKIESDWVLSGNYDWPQPTFLYPMVERTGRLRLIAGDEEIAPDVHTLHVPGHTPGCMALVLRGSGMPVTVLGGDAVKNIAELATGKAAMSLDQQATAASIEKVRNIAQIVIPGHDRTLEVHPDRIVAISSLHETIIVPAGVVGKDPRYLELVLEPTWLPIS